MSAKPILQRSASRQSIDQKRVTFSSDVLDEEDESGEESLQAQLWDWPLQKTPDGLARLDNTKHKFEVALNMGAFVPKEIQVKVCGNDLMIYCQHDESSDCTGLMSRQLFRSYHLPSDIDLRTLKSHMTTRGILHITAAKCS